MWKWPKRRRAAWLRRSREELCWALLPRDRKVALHVLFAILVAVQVLISSPSACKCQGLPIEEKGCGMKNSCEKAHANHGATESSCKPLTPYRNLRFSCRANAASAAIVLDRRTSLCSFTAAAQLWPTAL